MMKTIIFTLICFYMSINLCGQDFQITFTGKGESTVVDSVKAENLNTGASVTLPGNETLILSRISSSDPLLNNTAGALLFPNPLNGSALLALSQAEAGEITLTVRNLSGQVAARINMNLNAGDHSFRINFERSGIYLVEVEGQGFRQSIKAVCLEITGGSSGIEYLGSTSGGIYSKGYFGEKSQQNLYRLAYYPGNMIQYTGFGGRYKTLLFEAPVASKNFEFEFFDCTDPYGKTYRVVRVGTQVWMAENLAYLPSVSFPDNISEASYRYYVYDYKGQTVQTAKATSNYKAYGVLYNWPAAMDVCPVGWFLPQKPDWEVLLNSLRADPSYWAFTAPKAGELYPYIAGEMNMSIFPGFRELGNLATYWSSSQEPLYFHPNDLSAWVLNVKGYNNYSWVSEYSFTMTHYYYPSKQTKNSGHSVRCLRGTEPTVPSIKISEISNIQSTSVSLTAEVTNNGGGGLTVTSKGFCWGRNPDPTVADDTIKCGSGMGNFSATISGLLSSRIYYIRAYAVNERGIGYSETQMVTTRGGVVSLETIWLDNITDTSAFVGGLLLSEGGYAVGRIGFCWSLDNNPTVDDHVVYQSAAVRDTFYCQLSGFGPGQTVFFKPFVINELGNNYGALQQFISADGSFEYEGEVYGYSAIGDQIWMNQNLRYLPFVTGNEQVHFEEPNYYVYGYRGSDVEEARTLFNYKHYGVLYNLPAVMDESPFSDRVPSGVRGVCPYGWHLPSKGEFDKLLDFIGQSNTGLLKSQFGWDMHAGNGSPGTLFNALPGGQMSSVGFWQFGQVASFWSSTNLSTEQTSSTGYSNIAFLYIRDWTYVADFGVDWDGLSVRCVRNSGGNSLPEADFTYSPEAALINEEFNFDPSLSYDCETRKSQLLYRWDWEGDGRWDTDPHGLIDYYYAFDRIGNFNVMLEVKDQAGAADSASHMVTVCEGRFVDPRDSTSYLYIEIGGQTWMAENLKYLPSINELYEGSMDQPRYYVNGFYDESGSVENARQDPNYKTYGALYNWAGAQTACPDGWHLPTDAEWKELEQNLGMTTAESNITGWRETGKVGKKLKTVTGWNNSGTARGSNESRFMAKAAGGRNDYFGIGYSDNGFDSDFWTSTNYSSNEAYLRHLIDNSDGVYRVTWWKKDGNSVRCVKDK